MTVNKVLQIASSLVGAPKYGSAHLALVNDYNVVKPLPVGYAVTNHDDWCDVFVTVVFQRAGLSHLIGRECGVERHIAIFKQLGIWLEDERITPLPGDVITWNWDSNVYPNSGWADHIGIVEKVVGNTIHTIEGNSNGAVRRNTYPVGYGNIRGYARPKYASTIQVPSKTIDELAQEVLLGLHGTGEARKVALGSQYEAVQAKVNDLLARPSVDPIVLKYGDHTLTQSVLDKILNVCRHYDILPSYALTILHFEGLWGNSEVAKLNNNWGGMTWTGNPNRPSGVVVSKGTSRPSSEGGHYMKYNSIDDFLKDWAYLLRAGGIYKVSGKRTFTECIKGMFQPLATYNYAAVGLETYLTRTASRLKSIEQANGSLSKYDVGFVTSEVQPDKIEVVKEDIEVLINGTRYVPEK